MTKNDKMDKNRQNGINRKKNGQKYQKWTKLTNDRTVKVICRIAIDACA